MKGVAKIRRGVGEFRKGGAEILEGVAEFCGGGWTIFWRPQCQLKIIFSESFFGMA